MAENPRPLPAVSAALEGVGGLRYNPLLALPEPVRGPVRPEDRDLDVLTGRRPLVECVLANAAAKHRGLTIRRGTAVTSLLIGSATRCGVLYVRGARIAAGEELAADLAVDMTGTWPPTAWPTGSGLSAPTGATDPSLARIATRSSRWRMTDPTVRSGSSRD